MKLFKFNSVKCAAGITVLYALSKVLLMDSLSALVADNPRTLLQNGILVLGLYVLSAVLMSANYYTKGVAYYWLTNQINSRIDSYYQRLGIAETEAKAVGERTGIYVNDVPRLIDLTLNRVLNLIFNATLIVFVLLALLKIHWTMLLMGVVSSVLLILIPKLFESKLSEYILLSQKGKERFLASLTEILNGFSAFVQNNAFHKFRCKSETASEQYADSISKIDIFAGNISAVLTFSGNFFTLVSLLVLSYLVIQKQVAAGTLLSVMGLIPALGDAMTAFVTDKTFYQSGKTLYREKFADIPERYERRFTQPCLRKKAKIEMMPQIDDSLPAIQTIQTKNLCVQYKNNSVAIKDVFLEFGKKYAIVGASGSGKSTLIKAMMGEITDYSGEILVNGVPKDHCQTLFGQIAYISQNVYLFNDTLENNIRMENDSCDVGALLKKVGLSEFDPQMMIEENGKNLSGGQKQRIALARALARNKQIFFLDEVTSALDPTTSSRIDNLLLRESKMLVMITHKLTDELSRQLDAVIDITA